MKKTIDELLPIALQCGISIFDFYDMTLKEVIETIKAYEKSKRLCLQEQAYISYQQAQLTALFISASFAKSKTHLPTIQEAFKGVFEEDKRLEIEKEKSNMLNFVINHNLRRSK